MIYSIIVIIFGVIVFILLCLLFFVNRLSLFRGEVENHSAIILSYIEERVTLFENISSFLIGKVRHEDEFVREVEDKLKSLRGIKKINESILLLKNTEDVLVKFFKLEDVYSFLKDDEEFISFKEQYQEHIDRIDYTMDHFDQVVRKYNDYKSGKLISILSKMLNYPDYDCYYD